MQVLIVESNANLAALWQRPLSAWGHGVTIATGQLDAVRHLSTHDFEAIILDLKLTEGSAMAVADFANYRQPQAHIIAVTSDRCFSDGSIFAHLGNARVLLPRATSPDDLGKMVEYYAA